MSDPQSEQATAHGEHVPDAVSFRAMADRWRRDMGADEELRREALRLQERADRYHYGLLREWGGVPIVRLAEDILVLQEIIWEVRPDRIVETGIARGGSLLLDASLMNLAGIRPAVLGIDIRIFPHTRLALENHPLAQGISLCEADSISVEAVKWVSEFIAGSESCLLVLDSNHTHSHVLGELRTLGLLLPVGSLILVADTLIEEHPHGYYSNRPWDRGNSPLSAIQEFLATTSAYALEERWARRALVTEFRDGALRRTSP